MKIRNRPVEDADIPSVAAWVSQESLFFRIHFNENLILDLSLFYKSTHRIIETCNAK
jgi:hypothetical protein